MVGCVSGYAEYYVLMKLVPVAAYLSVVTFVPGQLSREHWVDRPSIPKKYNTATNSVMLILVPSLGC